MVEPGEDKYRIFLVLGIGVQVDEPNKDQAVVSFAAFDASNPVFYPLRKLAAASKPKGILARALWVINIPEGAPLREAYHYAHGLETLAPIIPFCVA